ncbi:hypothetical protein [Proteiniborus sp. MB09-C3]|uniref:hypothetical protein n=1 Tax=Proteiniborus sp. MB09-C3 TaxID=3050072 RepID=UPI00255520EF|nr:hypothetical protein [Proteiniborus sp. MB09-C3]WIV12937.1 hypothetical protein QO263_04300 [Proteiniborus sp. MB09-C3]
MVKKIAQLIGLIFILAFNFLGMEYLMYSLLSVKSNLLYLAFPLFLLVMLLVINALNRFGWYRKNVNNILVLVAVFIGLGMLKLVL